MGTDYDPPSRYEENANMPGFSTETLLLLEKEMGIDLFGGVAMMASKKPEEEKKPRNERKDKRATLFKEMQTKKAKRKEDPEVKERRNREWAEGGDREGREAGTAHELVVEKHNEDFVKYYKGFILEDKEWDSFYAKLKEPLDICFRINSVDKNF